MNARSRPRPYSSIPRARGLPLVGSVPHVALGGYGFLERAQAECGDCFRVDLGVDEVVFVSNPDDLERVFVSGADTFTKDGPFWESVREGIGKGLATNKGELWRRHRRLMNPAFRVPRLKAMRDVIEHETAVATMLLEEQRHGGDLDVSIWTANLLSTLTGRLLIGASLKGPEFERFKASMRVLIERAVQALVYGRLPRWMPVPGAAAYRDASAFVHSAVDGIIQQRRQSPEASGRNDLLAMLLAERDDKGGMSAEDLRGEVIVTYVAGFETTAWALAWGLKLLAERPDQERRLREAIEGCEDPLDNEWLHASFLEMIRLYPSAPFLPRMAQVDAVLSGYEIPKGTTVVAMPWLVHRNPRVWDDPLTYDPSRHVGRPDRPRLSMMAFGAGKRLCIGKGLAFMEGQIILDHLLRRLRPRLPADKRTAEPRRIAATLSPPKGVWLRFEPVH